MQKYNWISKGRTLLLLTLSSVLWMACNKGFERVLPPGNNNDTTRAIIKQAKVLMVILDGARGQSVRDLNSTNISALTDHSIYAWNSISDADINSYTTYADIFTGVTKDKHSVGADLNNTNLKNFPSFFKYIKARQPSIRIATYTTVDGIGDKIITDSDDNRLFANDDNGATQAALTELGNDSAGVVVVQYSNINKQGKQFGYDLSSPQYKNALLQADDDLGKMLNIIKARKSYLQEKWMVVVMSSHGGPFAISPDDDDHTILSNPAVNNFVLYYTQDYLPSFIDKPYTGNRYIGKAVHLVGNDANAVYATVNDTKNFDFSEKQSLTIEMKIKVMPGANGDYSYSNTSILAKRASLDAGIVGWAIVLNQKGWQINIGQNAPGRTNNIIVGGADISDGNWHDIAVAIVTDTMNNNSRTVRTYTDGKANNTSDITGSGNLNNTAPLTLGYLPYIGSYPAPDAYVTEVKIFLAAATDKIISDYACQTFMTKSHPLYDQSIGYWPATDGQGAILKDQSGSVANLQIHGTYSWLGFNNLICPAAPNNVAQTMPQSIDVCRQVMDWLQVSVDPRWNLDGKVWTTRYVSMNNN
ncbi:DUF4983 domain-containing protein [Chitinophaga silvatica]|nr:DUF4983 domain-containing protein [Chitinophaga silvatica]